MGAGVGSCQKRVDGRLGLGSGASAVEVVDEFVEHEIRSCILATLLLKSAMSFVGVAVILVRVVKKSDPGSGVNEDHECGSP